MSGPGSSAQDDSISSGIADVLASDPNTFITSSAIETYINTTNGSQTG